MTEKKSWTKDFWSGTYWASDTDEAVLDEVEKEMAEEDNDSD